MKRPWILVMALVLLALPPLATAQEEPPDWAQQLLDQQAQILALLQAGVTLAPEQGATTWGPMLIQGGGDHNAAVRIINTTADGYGLWIRGGIVGAVIEAPISGSRGVGAWFNGDGTGLIAEGFQFNGIKAVNSNGLYDPVYPPWGGECAVDYGAVADAVWNEPVNEHQVVCSTGAAVNGRRCRAAQ